MNVSLCYLQNGSNIVRISCKTWFKTGAKLKESACECDLGKQNESTCYYTGSCSHSRSVLCKPGWDQCRAFKISPVGWFRSQPAGQRGAGFASRSFSEGLGEYVKFRIARFARRSLWHRRASLGFFLFDLQPKEKALPAAMLKLAWGFLFYIPFKSKLLTGCQ